MGIAQENLRHVPKVAVPRQTTDRADLAYQLAGAILRGPWCDTHTPSSRARASTPRPLPKELGVAHCSLSCGGEVARHRRNWNDFGILQRQPSLWPGNHCRLSDFFFAAAAKVASFVPLSSAAAASSHFWTCSLYAASPFLLSAAAVASLCPSKCSLVAAGSSPPTCMTLLVVIFLHDFCFKFTVALFESGSFFTFHLFTRLAFDALRYRVFPPFFLSLKWESFFLGSGITNCAITHL